MQHEITMIIMYMIIYFYIHSPYIYICICISPYILYKVYVYDLHLCFCMFGDAIPLFQDARGWGGQGPQETTDPAGLREGEALPAKAVRIFWTCLSKNDLCFGPNYSSKNLDIFSLFQSLQCESDNGCGSRQEDFSWKNDARGYWPVQFMVSFWPLTQFI